VSPSVGLPARLRSLGGRCVRRLGLLPGGDPDGLGDDAKLGDVNLQQRVALFFPEPPINGYQAEQWLSALEELDREHGVVVLTQDSRTTARLRAGTRLPVLCVARSATLERLLERGHVGLVLYVSHHPRNFLPLRFGGVAHVYLGHGDSDKAVSASNQLKAYDRVFVAGQAGIDRITAELLWFDLDRLIPIGRPQLAPIPRRASRYDRPSVLYAPTWEGAQASMAYSSVPSSGLAIVRSLHGQGFRVVYRPHPRMGANRPDVAAADRLLREEFSVPAAREHGSMVRTDEPLAEAFADADILVTDVSSVAVEWLPTRRPIVVTVPSEPGAVVGPSPLLETVPRLTNADAGLAGALVRKLLDEDPAASVELVEYYLGRTDDEAPIARFVEACGNVLTARETAISERARA
jgi:hypothetical protein